MDERAKLPPISTLIGGPQQQQQESSDIPSFFSAAEVFLHASQMEGYQPSVSPTVKRFDEPVEESVGYYQPAEYRMPVTATRIADLPQELPMFDPSVKDGMVSFTGEFDKKLGDLTADYLMISEFIHSFAPLLHSLSLEEEIPDYSAERLLNALMMDEVHEFLEFLRLLLVPLIDLYIPQKDFFQIMNADEIPLTGTLPFEKECMHYILALFAERTPEFGEYIKKFPGSSELVLPNLTLVQRIAVMHYLIDEWLRQRDLEQHIDKVIMRMNDMRKIQRRDQIISRNLNSDKLASTREKNALLRELDILNTLDVKDSPVRMAEKKMKIKEIEDKIAQLSRTEEQIADQLASIEAIKCGKILTMETFTNLTTWKDNRIDCDAVMKHRFFLQNRSLGKDRHGRNYWLFRSIPGLFLKLPISSAEKWQRIVGIDQLNNFIDKLETNEERILRSSLYSESIVTAEVIGINNAPTKVQVENYDSRLRILGFMKDLIRTTFAPAVNLPESEKYKHYKSLYIKAMIPFEVSEFKEVKKWVLDIASVINSGNPVEVGDAHGKKKISLYKAEYRDISPLQFCFLLHDLKDIAVEDYRKTTQALEFWIDFVDACENEEQLIFFIVLLLRTVEQLIESDDEFQSYDSDKLAAWIDAPDAPEEPPAKRARTSRKIKDKSVY